MFVDPIHVLRMTARYGHRDIRVMDNLFEKETIKLIKERLNKNDELKIVPFVPSTVYSNYTTTKIF